MCLIRPEIDHNVGDLYISAPDMPRILANPNRNEKETAIYEVQIWRLLVSGLDEGEEVSNWLSTYLGFPALLVRTPSNFKRELDKVFVSTVEETGEVEHTLTTGYSDCFPFLVVGEASLQFLNDNLVHLSTNREKVDEGEEKEEEESSKQFILKMDRFRPNIVLRGTSPFEEDGWKSFEFHSSSTQNTLKMWNVRPCSRCTLPNINQQTAKRSQEAALTLQLHRKGRNKLISNSKEEVFFGVNTIADKADFLLSIGDKVTIAEKGDPLFVPVNP